MSGHDNEFARQLRYYRAKAGLSLADVAKALGVSSQYVLDVERGSRAPFASERLPVLARLLDVAPSIFINAKADVDGFFRLPLTGVPEQDRLAAFFAATWMALPLHQVQEILAVIECQCDGCQSTPPGTCYSEQRTPTEAASSP